MSGGLTVVPDYAFADAPQPKVIVVPAQLEPSAAELAWLRRASKATDLTMSVCTGAAVLARAGLLDGKAATTHHGAYAFLAAELPAIDVRRGPGASIAETPRSGRRISTGPRAAFALRPISSPSSRFSWGVVRISVTVALCS